MERRKGEPSFQMVEVLAKTLDAAYVEFFIQGPPGAPAERFAATVDGLGEDEVRWLLNGARLLRRANTASDG